MKKHIKVQEDNIDVRMPLGLKNVNQEVYEQKKSCFEFSIDHKKSTFMKDNFDTNQENQ